MAHQPTANTWLARAFQSATAQILRYPVAVVALAIGVALAALLLTGSQLGYRTSRLDLLNPKSDFNRLWIEYIKEFGEDDDAVVVVEGPSRDEVVPVLKEVSALLAREDRHFHAVLHEVDLAKVRAKGLHYLPPAELLAIEGFLHQATPVLNGDWSPLNVGAMAAGMCAQLEARPQPGTRAHVEATQAVVRLASGLEAALGPEPRYRSPWPEMPAAFATLSELSAEYLLTNEGKLGFVLLRLTNSEQDGFTRGSAATDALRKLIADISARHPETKIGLTGLPIMENDEMRSSQSSMTWASIVSMVGVTLLFIAGFGGLRHAMLANVALMIGMAWAFGFVTLSVGHLNILSVSFTVTLIGIGIDYGVHYISRYMQLREQKLDVRTALVQTSGTMGPAITTGAVTTAVSFFAAGFTEFTGIAELGIIAGGGLLFCAVAQLFILPPLVALVDQTSLGQRLPSPLPVHRWIAPVTRYPRLVLLVGVVGSVFVAGGIKDLWYDHNLLNLQPEGLESVQLEQQLLEKCNQSVWYALSIADSREELLELKARFLKLPTVERTEEIVSLLPVDQEAKRPIIERIQTRLAGLPERPPVIAVDRPEHLGRVLARTQELIATEPSGALAARHLEEVRNQLRKLPLGDCYATLSHFQQQMAGDLLSRLYALKNMADPEPPRLSDLPPGLVDRFVGQHGKHLLKIYGKGNIWDMQSLDRFVKDVRAVDPRVTGNPLQAHAASLQMKKSYEQSALYALVIILVVLWLDFRNLLDVLLASLPLGLGVVLMFGLLGYWGIPLNPANMIALPLILGIGVDYGVHIVHEYHDQRGRYQMSSSTAVAVFVDSLTTIVGYGALMVASHRGLQSLGRVLTIGVSTCFFCSVVILPALLAWMSRNRVAPETLAEPPVETPPVPPAPPGRIWRRDGAEQPGGATPHFPGHIQRRRHAERNT
ncbi:MAG: MMPL family transporter [Planctomycetaceae bacterium]|nr:MMPL family transporter [Planctomycetaceae bacterium]